MADVKSVFETLSKINVNDKTEKKNGLTYLSWAWAWGEVKKHFPTANYTIYENSYGMDYFSDGRTCWVKTGVTIEGLEHIEYLPVMDYKNKSIPVESVTSFDVNKAIQRSLTKAVARHGLGLYIYAGEDLPEEEKKSKEQPKTTKDDTFDKWFGSGPVTCPVCGGEVQEAMTSKKTWTPGEILAKYGMCRTCYEKKEGIADDRNNGSTRSKD